VNNMYKTNSFLIYSFIAIFSIFTIVYGNAEKPLETKEITPEQYQAKIQHLNQLIEYKNSQLKDSKKEIDKLKKEVEKQSKEHLQVYNYKATAYAPLCDDAVEGMCYSGDPNVTRSGRSPQPYYTVAVDPDVIPLGTIFEIKINSEWQEVRADDTGGAIQGNMIDYCVATVDEASSFGVQSIKVRFPNGR